MLNMVSTFFTMESRNSHLNESFNSDYAEEPDLLELMFHLYVDQSNQHLLNMLEYVEEEFDNHSKWVVFGNDMMQYIVNILGFLSQWVPNLPMVELPRSMNFIEQLDEISGVVLFTINSETNFEPMDPQYIEIFKNRLSERMNTPC